MLLVEWADQRERWVPQHAFDQNLGSVQVAGTPRTGGGPQAGGQT